MPWGGSVTLEEKDSADRDVRFKLTVQEGWSSSLPFMGKDFVD